MYYCGIDLASKTSAMCVLDGKSKVVWEQVLRTDEGDIRTEMGRWRKLRIVIEASPLAEWAARVLEENAHEVVVIDPRRAKAVICTKKKIDKLDARNLARMQASRNDEETVGD